MAATFHLCRGDALNRLMRIDEAEAAWLEALQGRFDCARGQLELTFTVLRAGRDEESRSSRALAL